MSQNTIQNSDIEAPVELKELAPFKISQLNNTTEDTRTPTRSPRSSTSRRTSTSDQRPPERPPIVFGGGSRFNLPDSVIRKLEESDEVASFVVYSSGNLEQKENYFAAIDRGWRPLDAREYPELCRQYELSPFGKTEEDYLIRRGGQIAMKREKKIDDAEKDYYDSERHRQEYMASMYRQSDPRLPRPFLDERTRQRSRV